MGGLQKGEEGMRTQRSVARVRKLKLAAMPIYCRLWAEGAYQVA